MTKLWLTTFYTEGEPHDGGADLRREELEFQALVSPHVDEYLSFCPRGLRAESEDAAPLCANYSSWLESHPHRAELTRFSEDWVRAGFLAWKPYLCRRVLARDDVAVGDLVLYHDVNVTKYPQYRLHIHEWRSLAISILDELGCDFFASVGLPMKYDTKAYLIRKYLGPQPEWLDQRGVWAGILLMRKSPTAMELVAEWTELCSSLDNISPLPNPDPHPEFVWHSVDQSVLGVLAARWRLEGRLPLAWPRYAVARRTFGWSSIVEVRDPSQMADAGRMLVASGSAR